MEHSWLESQGVGEIHVCRWTPEGSPRAILQIVHGIAEYAARYDGFAEYLAARGFLVVAEDHMGHGQSINGGGVQGYFHGGWFTAVEDTYRLLCRTREEYPNVPYILLGHSMGSFMVRTLLCRHPDSGIAGAILTGTGWQPTAAMPAIVKAAQVFCRRAGERTPSQKLDRLIFGGYNRRVERPRTAYDWLTRDEQVVDAYVADPLCGFVATAGLLRDLMLGIQYIQQPGNLMAMNKFLPVLILSGLEDPVGNYGRGVQRTAQAFWDAGMENVTMRLYPLCRHELLNELNKLEIYQDILRWLEPVLEG